MIKDIAGKCKLRRNLETTGSAFERMKIERMRLSNIASNRSPRALIADR